MIDDSASSGFSQDTQPASESEASFHRFSQASIPAACVRRSLLQNRWRPMARRRRAERVICFGSDATQRRSTLAKICEDHQYERFQRSNCTIFCLKKPYNFSCPMFQEDQVDAASDAVKAEFDRLGKNWDFAKEAPGGSLVWRFGGLDFLVESVSMSSWRAEDCWKKVDLNVGSSGWAREILDKDGQQKLWDDLCFGYLDYLDYDMTALNIQSGCLFFSENLTPNDLLGRSTKRCQDPPCLQLGQSDVSQVNHLVLNFAVFCLAFFSSIPCLNQQFLLVKVYGLLWETQMK